MKQVLANVAALMSGIIFGLGLLLSGMANPQIVLAFFDVVGLWDSALLWVMVGAISVSMMMFFMVRFRQKSYLGFQINWPQAKYLDWRLITGSVMFGVGWGLAGICPGPALVVAGSGVIKVFWFISAMLLGMYLFCLFDSRYKQG